MIAREPVRGSVPPPWFWALPGIERLRLLTDGLILQPPMWRLLGIRPAHIGPGSGTFLMPASGCLQGLWGNLDISTLVETSLTGAAMTTLPPNVDIAPLTLEINYFRPTRPQPGNLMARARVVNGGRFFSFAKVEVEDPDGRQIAYGVSHLQICPIETPIPAPPDALRPVEEPSYATPDPYLRAVSQQLPPSETWNRRPGDDIVRQVAKGTFTVPFQELLGYDIVELEEERLVIAIPASEWFCRFQRSVSPSLLAAFANAAGGLGGATLVERGESFAGLNQFNHFYRAVPADGKPLRAEVRMQRRERDIIFGEAHVYDADRALVSWWHGFAVAVDSSKRQKRPSPKAQRVLATLMFTDIVDSTGHAERLGDARWGALLEEHREIIRRELTQHEGAVVETVGDGVFLRFDAPAPALACARAIRDAVKRLGLEVRLGVHVGECEMKSGKLTGMAVHLAARIQAAALPGEILVSGTVKDLTVGSAVRFEDRGQHLLQGVPGEWHLFVLAE